MINIYEIDEYWWVIMRDDIPGNPIKILFMFRIAERTEISGILRCAGDEA
jgi:hypothetical protein